MTKTPSDKFSAGEQGLGYIYQARLALLDIGLLANVQTAINTLPEPDKTKAQIEWEYSNALQRNNPFVTTLGTALGLSSDDIDNLFITASGL